MLTTAGIAPSSPLLLPGLAKAARTQVKRTTAALAELATNISKTSPDVLLIIAGSTETSRLASSYALLQGRRLPYEFSKFGDLVTHGECLMATGFTHQLKESCETSFPMPLVTPPLLPFSFAVPAVCLGSVLAEVPLACLQVPPNTTLEDMNQLGSIINEYIDGSHVRVAMLAVGMLAHHERGLATQAKIFDQRFQAAVSAGSRELLINLDPALRVSTQETLWAPTALTFTALGERAFAVTPLAYEAPHGVGFFTAAINLN